MTVYLVGAGPGDPDLITRKGLDLIRSSDVLVHDRLVAPELVSEAPAAAIRIARTGLAQKAVDELLVSHGRRGVRVVRLKGGDPFVFGRGGEEALALAAAGVPYEVVPGVSSIAAVPGAAGIPVTHRGMASQLTIATAHCHENEAPDYAALARAPGTLVLLMSLAQLEHTVAELIAHGKSSTTPAAVVSRGTRPDQQSARTRLAELPTVARGLPSPALVVIGETVGLASLLKDAP